MTDTDWFIIDCGADLYPNRSALENLHKVLLTLEAHPECHIVFLDDKTMRYSDITERYVLSSPEGEFVAMFQALKALDYLKKNRDEIVSAEDFLDAI